MIVGNDIVAFMNDELKENNSTQKFTIHPHWIYSEVDNRKLYDIDENIDLTTAYKHGSHLQFMDKRILIVRDGFEFQYSKSKIEIDYCLLLSDLSLDDLLQTYSPKLVVLDASLPYYLSDRLEEDCKKHALSYHNLKKDKALHVKL